jgi:DNA-binding protein Fis
MSEADDVQQLIKLLDPRLTNDQTDLYRRALEQFDRVILRRALERCEGNLTRAAAMLGLSRVTLRSKLKSLGLTAGKAGSAESSSPNPNQPGTSGHPTHPNHSHGEHPQTHLHTPHTPSTGRDPGQDLTRQDKPGAGFSEPHLGEAQRREAAGAHNFRPQK